MFKVQSLKFKVVSPLVALILSVAGVPWDLWGQVPTNNISPATVEVITDTNGNLLSPANLVLSPANGGLGVSNVNLLAGAHYSSAALPSGLAAGLHYYWLYLNTNLTYSIIIPGNGAGNDAGAFDDTNNFESPAVTTPVLYRFTNSPVLVMDNGGSGGQLIGTQVFAALTNLHGYFTGNFDGVLGPDTVIPGSAITTPITNTGSSFAWVSGSTSNWVNQSRPLTPGPGTATFTNGTEWVAISGNNATTNNGFYPGTYLVLPNGGGQVQMDDTPIINNTLVHLQDVVSSTSSGSYSIYVPQELFYDSVPRIVGYVGSGGDQGFRGQPYSANSWRLAFLMQTNSMQMVQGNDNYGYRVSIGSGWDGDIIDVYRGNGPQNSIYKSLAVLPDGTLSVRFGITNIFGNIILLSPAVFNFAPTLTVTNAGTGITVGTTAVAGFITITNNGRLCKIPYY